MKCDCVMKANEALKEKHLALKLHSVIHFGDGKAKTLDMNSELAIETVSLKKGVKPIKLFPAFCPFCGTEAK